MSKKSNKQKTPVISAAPNPQKTPKIPTPPPQFHGGHIAWRFSGADKGGPFAWSRLERPEIFKGVIERLSNLEMLNDVELQNQGCHFIQVSDFSKAAKDRLIEIGMDDLDQLYSFRIQGKPRVFAIHRGSYTRVLWYDPDHLVCPSPKRNT